MKEQGGESRRGKGRRKVHMSKRRGAEIGKGGVTGGLLQIGASGQDSEGI